MEKMSPKEPKITSKNAAETEEIKPTGKNRVRAEIFDWVQTFCQALFARCVYLYLFVPLCDGGWPFHGSDISR